MLESSLSSSSGNPLVILNPAANRGKMDGHRALVRSRAQQEGAEYVETTRRGEVKELGRNAAKEGRSIVVVGGDGSVHEVVNGILAAGKRVPLGIVGSGSGNDFAWNTLKLPRDPETALERAFHGQLVEVDAGRANDYYFVNSFSVGLDADIAMAADRLKKVPFMEGARLYYSASLKQLLFGYQRCPWLSFELDDTEYVGEIQGRRYVLMAITNGPTYGAGFRINPTADHTDGLFDVCTIDHTPLLRALKLLPVVKKGEHAGQPEVTFYRAKSVYIKSRAPVHAQMDGETVRDTTYKAEILPGALLVRV